MTPNSVSGNSGEDQFALWEIIRFFDVASAEPLSTLSSRVPLLFGPLCVLNYVVNIGFAKSWGSRPLLVSVIVLVVLGGVAYLIAGSFNSRIVGVPLNLWLGYFYAHLGLSFVVAALIATPGCEMRAIPELFGRLRGMPSAEHECPVTFISTIDAWERSCSSG